MKVTGLGVFLDAWITATNSIKKLQITDLNSAKYICLEKDWTVTLKKYFSAH